MQAEPESWHGHWTIASHVASLASRCHHDCRCCNSLLAPASKPHAYCHSRHKDKGQNILRRQSRQTLFTNLLLANPNWSNWCIYSNRSTLRKTDAVETVEYGWVIAEWLSLEAQPRERGCRSCQGFEAVGCSMLDSSSHTFAFSPDSSVDSISSCANWVPKNMSGRFWKAWWSICLEYLHASGPSGGVRHSDRPGRNVRSVSTSNDAHVRMGTNRNPYRFWTEEELQSSDSKKFWRRGRAEVSKEDVVLQTSRKPRHNGFTWFPLCRVPEKMRLTRRCGLVDFKAITKDPAFIMADILEFESLMQSSGRDISCSRSVRAAPFCGQHAIKFE